MPGLELTNEAWLSARVDRMAQQWGCSQRRTNATLWWYSTSYLLLTPAVRELVLTGAGVDVGPRSVRIRLRDDGYLDQVIAGPPLTDGAATLGAHVDEVLGSIIEPLARTGQATERSLWAIAVDSLATAVLAATSVLPGGTASAAELADSIAEAAPRLRPLPRFVEIAVPGSAGSIASATAGAANPSGTVAVRRYVRRSSCCLLVRVPDGKCMACPNQLPADREERLQRHAARSGVIGL